jgi:hypothetical protein
MVEDSGVLGFPHKSMEDNDMFTAAEQTFLSKPRYSAIWSTSCSMVTGVGFCPCNFQNDPKEFPKDQ